VPRSIPRGPFSLPTPLPCVSPSPEALRIWGPAKGPVSPQRARAGPDSAQDSESCGRIGGNDPPNPTIESRLVGKNRVALAPLVTDDDAGQLLSASNRSRTRNFPIQSPTIRNNGSAEANGVRPLLTALSPPARIRGRAWIVLISDCSSHDPAQPHTNLLVPKANRALCSPPAFGQRGRRRPTTHAALLARAQRRGS